MSTHDDDTCPHLVVLGRLEAENARLKAELTDLKSKADGFKAEVDGYKHTGYSIGMLQGKLTQKCQDYLEAQKQNEANVQLVRNLKAEVERLNAFTTRTIIPNEELQAQVERLTEAGDHMAAVIIEYRCSPWGRKVPNAFTVWQAWFAAKEGKGQP